MASQSRTMESARTALLLGLALSLNWTWGRGGGSIQSEPLFTLLEMLAVLAAARAGRRGGVGAGCVLGLALAACILTRHVGVCLAAASAIDLALRGRRRALGAAGLTAAVLERDAEGRVVRKSGVMGVVLEGGEVFPGDPIVVELPEAPHRALAPV